MRPSLKLDSAIKNAIFNQRKLGELGKWGKKNGASFQPKEMPNYLEGGSEGSLANDYKIQSEIQTNTNEDLKFKFIFIICIYI